VKNKEKDFRYRVLTVTVGGLLRLAFRMRWEGLEHLPEQGGALLASNHVSVLDPLVIAMAGSTRGRVIRFVAAAELFDHSVWGPILRSYRQVPVRRGAGDHKAAEGLATAVRGGALAGIFPEGGVRDGLSPLRGQSGAVRVAGDANIPIVPIGIWGTQARWPRGPFRIRPFRRLPLGLSIGVPFHMTPFDSSSADRRDATQRLMQVIEERVARARQLAEG
jgi:1-acyl-sn-glycerol-3-phosphate acyltransferase